MEDLLQVGAITQTHGIRGEVKVFPLTDDVGRFKKGISLILDLGRSRLDLQVETVKFFKQFVILKFKGYDSINEIEKFVKKNLYVTRENAVKLKKDEYFIADQKYADISRRMGFPAYTNEEGVNSLISEIKKLNSDLGIEKSFKEAGVNEEEFLSKVDMLADRAFEDQCTTANPRLPLVSELKQIMIDAYYGNEI